MATIETSLFNSINVNERNDFKNSSSDSFIETYLQNVNKKINEKEENSKLIEQILNENKVSFEKFYNFIYINLKSL